MNERIRQLKEQSMEWVPNMADPDTKIRLLNTEKFAELILRECADILMKPEYVMNHPEGLADYNRGWANGRLLGIEHIKEHFGVKE
jgi:hypothetical protein